jgi:hypothetical protein
MSYKIISLDKSTGQVVISVDGFSPMAIDLPLDENNMIPTGQALDSFLLGYVPHSLIDRKKKIEEHGIPNINEIESLVDPIIPRELTVEELWNMLRFNRDNLLASTDWTQLPDSQLTSAQIEAFQVYRQTLRDLPANTIDPKNPVFPEPPNLD